MLASNTSAHEWRKCCELKTPHSMYATSILLSDVWYLFGVQECVGRLTWLWFAHPLLQFTSCCFSSSPCEVRTWRAAWRHYVAFKIANETGFSPRLLNRLLKWCCPESISNKSAMPKKKSIIQVYFKKKSLKYCDTTRSDKTVFTRFFIHFVKIAWKQQ